VTFGASSRFPAEVTSVRLARRFAAQQMAALGLAEDSAMVLLAVSELVTNAVLHARTAFTITLRSPPHGLPGVRVEVQDDSPLPPTPASFGVAAMSGRGLVLVQACAQRWGVEPIPGKGKAVWCEIAGAGVAMPDDGARRSTEVTSTRLGLNATAEVAECALSEPLLRVVIPHVPVADLVAAKLQMEDLVRDLKVSLLNAEFNGDLNADGAHVGGRASAAEFGVAWRLDAAATDFRAGRLQMRSQALLAAGRGEREATVELRLPRSTAAAARRYRDALDEADALNSAGALLVGVSLKEHNQLRRWYLGEIVAQLEAGDSL